MDNEGRYEVLKRHATMLREHFDSVQIIVTRTTDDGTAHFGYGSGSWYERYGAMRMWLMREEERDRQEVREEGSGA